MGLKSTQYDVTIVGAGAVGSALALQLSQMNYRVALIDANPPSYAKSNPERVIALSQGSMRYMQRLGVWDDVIRSGVGHIESIHAFEPDHAGSVDMHADEIQASALGYVLEIRQLLQPLHDAIKGNVDFIYPAKCIAMQRQAQHTELHLSTEQGAQTLSTALLVAADGTNSHIRQLAGITTRGWDHNRIGIVASIACQHGHAALAYECFKEEGPLALLPLADGRFSLVWSVAPQHAVQLMDMDDTSFLRALAQAVGSDVIAQTGELTSLGKRACFPLELRIAKSFAQAGLALVGNAAHTIHPIAGQGMNLGLRDVAVLADVMQQDWAKDKLNGSMLAQTYAERRRLDTLAVTGFTESVLETFAHACPPMRWLRGKGLSLTQHAPSLKQVLLQQASGLGQMKGVGL